MIKYVISAILGTILYISGQEILDYQESKRYLACTLEHKNQFDFCQKGASWLYKNYPDRPSVYACLYPDAEDRFVCRFFNIERMN